MNHDTAPATDPIVTVRQLAEHLQTCEETIRRYARAGLLTPVLRVGQRYRFRRDEATREFHAHIMKGWTP